MADQPQAPAGAPIPDAKPPAESQSGKKKLVLSIVGAVVAVALIAAALTVAGVVGGGNDEAGEVFLSPAADVGADPFSGTPLATAPDSNLAKPAATAVSTVKPGQTTAITATSGNKPGLYGGTMNMGVCDSAQLISFLGSNQVKANAWVNALNADPNLGFGRKLDTASIPEYVHGLTPMVLTQDTRVTNHSFNNGKATKLQSVLQKGTAVLTDKYGVPRVKCYCGNPLLPPVAAKSQPSYKGTAWSDFDPAKIGAVQKSNTVIDVFALTDTKTGKLFDRPVGSQGPNDKPSTATASATRATPTTAAPTTTTTAAPAGSPSIAGKSYHGTMKLTDCVGITESGDSCTNKDGRALDFTFTCTSSTSCKSNTGREYKFDGSQWVTTYQADTAVAFTCDNKPLPTHAELRFSVDASGGIHGTFEQSADPVQPSCSNGFLLRYSFAIAAS